MINADPLDVVNFTYPFDIQPYTFMYRRPRELSRTLLFVNPFTPLVRLRLDFLYFWIFLGLSVCWDKVTHIDVSNGRVMDGAYGVPKSVLHLDLDKGLTSIWYFCFLL